MSTDDLSQPAAGPAHDRLSSPPSSPWDSEDFSAAVAVDDSPDPPAESAALRPTPAFEIDAADVVAHLWHAPTPQVAPLSEHEEPPDFSLECVVEEIPRRERHLVAVDRCPVCDGEWARARYILRCLQLRIVDCTGCGLGRLHPRPSSELIARFYPASYYGVTGAKFVPLVETLVRLVGARHVRALSRGLDPGARVLDVGCGRGVLLSAFARLGFEAHGFEMSPDAAIGVDPRAAVRIGQNLHEAKYPRGYFDQVVVWHVLEHLADPRRTLEEILRVLKPGGKLVVAVPNYGSLQARCFGAGWFHLDAPRHLFHFPAESLRQLLKSTGFRVEREHHFSLRQNPFGWVQSALNCTPQLPRNGLYTLLKRRGDGRSVCGRWGRFVLLAAYWLGMPLACLVSVADALLRQGASISIEARSPVD